MNKVLIISPYFAPVNTADMQRVRMSLPYFKTLGWDAEVVTIDEKHADISKDELLLLTVPKQIKIHKVKALNKKWTSKLGLGSIALRSLWFYKRTVDKLLASGNYRLIYFSTTQFPVCILGDHWKRKFGIPYVIDMQDPWHSDYYLDKPKSQRPPKYWLSYRLNKFLEPIAMRNVAGLISVSPNYITTLRERYPRLNYVPAATIPFGAFEPDMEIAANKNINYSPLLNKARINLVYVGRGGADMHKAVAALFEILQRNKATIRNLRLYFIGTSYAPAGQGKPTILPLARHYGLEELVTEITDRVDYYHGLNTLLQADALFIPGSDDAKYSASKIYSYLLTGKPVLAISNGDSPGYRILQEYGSTYNLAYNGTSGITELIADFIELLLNKRHIKPSYSEAAVKKYSAANMTAMQCDLFEQVLNAEKK